MNAGVWVCDNRLTKLVKKTQASHWLCKVVMKMVMMMAIAVHHISQYWQNIRRIEMKRPYFICMYMHIIVTLGVVFWCLSLSRSHFVFNNIFIYVIIQFAYISLKKITNKKTHHSRIYAYIYMEWIWNEYIGYICTIISCVISLLSNT